MDDWTGGLSIQTQFNHPFPPFVPPPLPTAHPIDIYSPDIQDNIDVTDERLRNLYDAFDRDFDGRLTKPELLQGLAQQGFHNLEGTRAFELLWETCEKIATIGGEEEGGGASPSAAAVGGGGGPREGNRITFAAFKRIVQRLKMELLFLPELHQHGASLAGHGSSHYGYLDSRAPTPVPYGGAAPDPPAAAAPAPTPTPSTGGGPVMVAPAPRLFSGIGGGDHTVPTFASPGPTPPPQGAAAVPASVVVHVGVGGQIGQAGAAAVAAAGGDQRPLTPRHLALPDYGTMGGAVEEARGGRGAYVDGAGAVVKFSSVDYNEKRYRAEVPVADTYRFFTLHRNPNDFMMRWLHLEGLDRLTILRFGVKYSLHPLCVEDALKLEDQQPKVNKYGSHFFVVMPFFRLTQESRRALDALRRQRRLGLGMMGGHTSLLKSTSAEAAAALHKTKKKHRSSSFFPVVGMGLDDDAGRWSDFQFRVEWSKLCLFVAGPPSYDTLISLHSKWELFNSDTDEIMHPIVAGAGGSGSPTLSGAGGDSGRVGGASVSSPSGSLSADSGCYVPAGNGTGGGGGGGGGSRTHAFESLVSALRVEYSVLRQGDSRHLLYVVWCGVVCTLIGWARV